MIVIGCNRDKSSSLDKIDFYFRDKRGFKHFLTTYTDTAYGALNLYMCGSIPNMTWEEYKALPDLIEVEKEVE